MSEETIEPDIAEAVHHVANRYGIAGLEALIGLAQDELEVARDAYAQLAPDGD